MAKRVPAFHSAHQLVYHTNYSCGAAMGILPAARRAGRDGRVECLQCQQLNRAARRRLHWKQYLKRLFGCSARKDEYR